MMLSNKTVSRFLTPLYLVLLLTGLIACGGAEAPPETAAPETAAQEPASEPANDAEAEPVFKDGFEGGDASEWQEGEDGGEGEGEEGGEGEDGGGA